MASMTTISKRGTKKRNKSTVCNDPIDGAYSTRRTQHDSVQNNSSHKNMDHFNSIVMELIDVELEQQNHLREEERDLCYASENEAKSDGEYCKDDDGGDSTIGTYADRFASDKPRSNSCNGKAKRTSKGRAKMAKSLLEKQARRQVGKFVSYKMKKRQLCPLKPGGKIRYQVCGMESVKVEMNDQRMKKIRTLMSKHNNFSDLDIPAAMRAHFECLLILDQANTNNSQGKGSRYPRYLRHYVGPGKFFSYHSDITRANQKDAHDFIERWIREEKIKTQNINGKPALQAKPNELEAKIRKLVRDHKHGIDDYMNLLDKLESGSIKFPEPEQKTYVDCESIPKSDSISTGKTARYAPDRLHVLADPGSPSAVFME